MVFFFIRDRDIRVGGKFICFLREDFFFVVKFIFRNFYSLVIDRGLDREEVLGYNIIFVVVDIGLFSLFMEIVIEVLIFDINDNFLVF